MKQCPQCREAYTDLIEVCPRCKKILVLKPKKVEVRRNADSPCEQGEDTHIRIVFSGKGVDAEYVYSILTSHDIPCATAPSGDADSGDILDVAVPAHFETAAVDLLADIYDDLFEMTETEFQPLERTGESRHIYTGGDFDSSEALRGISERTLAPEWPLLRILLYVLLFVLGALGLFKLAEWLF